MYDSEAVAEHEMNEPKGEPVPAVEAMTRLVPLVDRLRVENAQLRIEKLTLEITITTQQLTERVKQRTDLLKETQILRNEYLTRYGIDIYAGKIAEDGSFVPNAKPSVGG